MKSRNSDIIMTMELKEIFVHHRKLWRELNALDINRLTEKDSARIKYIEETGGIYFEQPGIKAEDKKAWENLIGFLKEVMKFGTKNRNNTIAAMILAGAAISRSDITLRPDLSQSIYQAKQYYQGGSPGVLKKSLQPVVSILTSSYAEFGAHLTSNGPLDNALKILLTDATKPLRVSYDLHTLDLSAINRAREDFILIDRRYEQHGGTQPGDSLHNKNDFPQSIPDEKKLFAPTHFELKADNFYCRELNEHGGDQIFWTAFFTYITNLQEVYKKIDDAITNNNGTLELKLGDDIQYRIIAWKSGDPKSCTPREEPYVLGLDFGPFRIHQGFFPWGCNIKCIEDDNQEYEAVSDVVDTVGDYASTISQGASVVAAVTAGTVVSAGAAAVSTVASTVSLTSDVVEAVIDIVNFFDENDTVGFIELSGEGDYIGKVSDPNPEPVTCPTGGGSSGGHYEIGKQEIFTEREAVDRNWRCKTETKYGHEESHSGILGFGNRGDSGVGIIFSETMDMILASSANCTSGYGHAEWIAGPLFQPPPFPFPTWCMGKVHWGVNAHHTVTFHPWVTALKLLTYL